jgi:hypothetical protein
MKNDIETLSSTRQTCEVLIAALRPYRSALVKQLIADLRKELLRLRSPTPETLARVQTRLKIMTVDNAVLIRDTLVARIQKENSRKVPVETMDTQEEQLFNFFVERAERKGSRKLSERRMKPLLKLLVISYFRGRKIAKSEMEKVAGSAYHYVVNVLKKKAFYGLDFYVRRTRKHQDVHSTEYQLCKKEH